MPQSYKHMPNGRQKRTSVQKDYTARQLLVTTVDVCFVQLAWLLNKTVAGL